MQRATDGTWSNATAILSNNVKNALACTYQTDVYVDGNGRGYFYGVSALIGDGGFFIATYDAGADKIDLIYSYDLDDFPPSPGLSEQAAFRMAAGSGGNDVTILWVDMPQGSSNTEIYFQGATITLGHLNTTFAWSNGKTLDPQVLKPGLGVFGVSDLIALPGNYGADAIILRDAAEVLYFVSGYNTASPAITPLTGGAEQPAGAVAATVGQDSNGVLTVFAIETGTTNLWYLQQQQAGGSFGTWVNLAGTLTTIASPATMAFGPELFAVDLSCDIYHQARTLADQVWVTRKVAEPAPSSPDNDQPQNIAGYNMEITALDDTGAPIPQAIVYVAADHPATIVVNCLSYHADTNTLVPVETDPNGQATVTYQAVDLKPPLFTMSSNADGSGVTRWCQSDVVQTDNPPPTPPATSVSAQLTGATTETLTSNGLIDPSYSDPSQAVQAINAAGPWMNPNAAAAGAVDTSRTTVPHWSLDFTAPEGPRFRILSDAEAEVMRENALGSSGLLGDACHFFKNAWHELQSFSASLVGDVLTVMLNGEKWTIQTLKQAGDALETVFTRIMQGLKDLHQLLKDVLDWLKMLFEWSDILNTHNVLREATNSMDRDIAMVFQNYALYPHMSVFENMAYGLRISGRPKADIAERVRAAARMLQPEDYLDRRPRQLSGGQRQRVAMGRAIVRKPAVFLSDEPLSNLDAKLRVQMRLEIKGLQHALGVTALYVTHDQVEAMTLADRMAVMNDGRAEQVGAPLEVYARPATMFVAGFIGSPPMNFLAPSDLTGAAAPALLAALPPGTAAIGIRPEHLEPVPADRAVLSGNARYTEALGAETLIHLARPEGETLTVRIAGIPEGIAPDARLHLAAAPATIRAFDREGRAIVAA
ncbi:ATP-binding cassette domain-containing protein [Amaricoccus sp.]|uniref:ABC transporter ATP-binding protein n=1 Tax=Amaricoccus sp. TaxID=1872485 RepID=UPI003FA55AE6